MTTGGAAQSRPHGPTASVTAIDWVQVRSILIATLRMRMRVGSGRLSRTSKVRGLIVILLIYAGVGFLLGSIAFAHMDVFSFVTLIHGVTLLVVGTTLLSESGLILFSPLEADLLGHRPIAPRTLLVAKIGDVLMFAVAVALILNLGSMVFGIALDGSPRGFWLVHLFGSVLIAAFASSMIVISYAALMKWIGRERLDSFLAWWQLAASMLLVAGYQLLPRMTDRLKGYHLDAGTPVLWVLPSAWFAALESVLCGEPPSIPRLVMAAAALALTIALPLLAVGKLATAYAGAFTALSETPMPARAGRAARVRDARPLPAILRAWMRDPVERGVFRLTATALRRDRDVRMRVYPTVGMVLVFACLPLVNRGYELGGPIMSLVFLATLANSAMDSLKTSPQHAAAEVFRVAPLDRPAPIFHGVRKAVLLGLVLPAFVLLIPVFAFTIHDRRALLLVLPVLFSVPTLSLLPGLDRDYVPFSDPPTMGRQSLNQIVFTLAGVAFSGLLAGLAYAAMRFGWLVPMLVAEVAVVALIHVLLLRRIRALRLSPPE